MANEASANREREAVGGYHGLRRRAQAFGNCVLFGSSSEPPHPPPPQPLEQIRSLAGETFWSLTLSTRNCGECSSRLRQAQPPAGPRRDQRWWNKQLPDLGPRKNEIFLTLSHIHLHFETDVDMILLNAYWCRSYSATWMILWILNAQMKS